MLWFICFSFCLDIIYISYALFGYFIGLLIHLFMLRFDYFCVAKIYTVFFLILSNNYVVYLKRIRNN